MEYRPIMQCGMVQDVAVIPVRLSQTKPSVSNDEIRKITEATQQWICAFDTGASTSLVSTKAAKALGFKISTPKLILKGATGSKKVDTCKLNILLPNGLLLVNQYATVADSDLDVLIGMDIIKNFDFSIFTRNRFCYISLAPRNHLDITHKPCSLDLQQSVALE